MSRTIRGHDGHLGRLKKHTLSTGHWHLAFCQVLRKRSRKCLSHSRPGRPSWLMGHGRGGGCWVLAYCQVSSSSVQRLQRRSRKCLSQSRPERSSWLMDRPDKHGGWVLTSRQVSPKYTCTFSGCSGVKNVSPNQKPGRPCWLTCPQRKKLTTKDIVYLSPRFSCTKTALYKFHWSTNV